MSYEERLVRSDGGRDEYLDHIGRDADAEIAALKADLARAVELLREIGKWERMFDDPDARMVVTKIDAFLAERGGEV